jgi:3-oxoacyl-[acyl-carrier protein] reductase
MTKPLAGKVAIVTGSSRGIGREVALELARQGARVAVNYRQGAEAAAEVVAEIAACGSEAIAVGADVATAAGAHSLVEAALAAYGTVDVLVSNAGITRDNLLLRMTEEDWDAVLDTNLKGAFHCVKAVQRTFLKRRAGRIIAIGSIVGLAGNAGQANYAAAKAGLVGLMRSVARELGSRGITANVVAPGFIDTEMTRALPPEAMDQALARIPLGRLGTPGDVAGLVAFLAGDAAAYITGQVFGVDGGLTL